MSRAVTERTVVVIQLNRVCPQPRHNALQLTVAVPRIRRQVSVYDQTALYVRICRIVRSIQHSVQIVIIQWYRVYNSVRYRNC